jgi:hypothetical protein
MIIKSKKSGNVGYKVFHGHENYEDKWWKNKPRFKSKHIMWEPKQNHKKVKTITWNVNIKLGFWSMLIFIFFKGTFGYYFEMFTRTI